MNGGNRYVSAKNTNAGKAAGALLCTSKEEAMIRREIGSSGNNYRFAIVVSFAICLCLQTAFATGSDKPRVAIKMPKVGEGISAYASRYLNLSTILAEMERSLQQTRKFEVLSRQGAVLDDIREEQQFAASDLAKGNAAESGGIENANFLILPTVQDFKFSRSSTPVPNLDSKWFRIDSGLLEIQAQVIDTTTGGIKSTFYLKSKFATNRQVVNSKGGAPSSQQFTNMAQKVSAQMADQLVDTVFPMKVISIKGNHIWINRGQDGGLKEGETLLVYRPGETLVDPDTGDVLGAAEEMIGNIKVLRINPKFTIAEMKAGKDGGMLVEKGDIVRKP
jgi:hypothetical protein